MPDLAAALNIVSTLALIGALVFAGLQVRTANRGRAEQAALAFINGIQSEGWTHALSLVLRVPAGLTAEEIDALGPEVGNAIEEYGVRIETVGYMVFRGIVALETVEQLLGGIVTLYWSRVKPWIERDRKRTTSYRQYEWVQWLAEQLEERRSGLTAEPAYIKHSGWKQSDARPTG